MKRLLCHSCSAKCFQLKAKASASSLSLLPPRASARQLGEVEGLVVSRAQKNSPEAIPRSVDYQRKERNVHLIAVVADFGEEAATSRGVHLQPPVWHRPQACRSQASAVCTGRPFSQHPPALLLTPGEETVSFFAGGPHLTHTHPLCDQ